MKLTAVPRHHNWNKGSIVRGQTGEKVGEVRIKKEGKSAGREERMETRRILWGYGVRPPK